MKAFYILISLMFCLNAPADLKRYDLTSNAYAIFTYQEQARSLFEALKVDASNVNGVLLKELATSSGLVRITCRQEDGKVYGKNHTCLIVFRAGDKNQERQMKESVSEAYWKYPFIGKYRSLRVSLYANESEEICSKLQMSRDGSQTGRFVSIHGSERQWFKVSCELQGIKMTHGSLIMTLSSEQPYAKFSNDVKAPSKIFPRLLEDTEWDLRGQYSLY